MITITCGWAGAVGGGSGEAAGVLVRGEGRGCGAADRTGVVGGPRDVAVIGGLGDVVAVVGIVSAGILIDADGEGAGNRHGDAAGVSFPLVETATENKVTMAMSVKIASKPVVRREARRRRWRAPRPWNTWNGEGRVVWLWRA